jgi:hypothetical protein
MHTKVKALNLVIRKLKVNKSNDFDMKFRYKQLFII